MRDFGIEVQWSLPISDEEPAGKNYELDQKFAELETAALSTSEQQYGDTVIPAKEPDWRHVLSCAMDLSKVTKDLRVFFLLTRALTKIYGLEGLLYGVQSLHTVCWGFWKELHPRMDLDGVFDPQLRFSILSDFGDMGTLVADMRSCILFTSHLGDISVKDAEKILDTGAVDIEGVSVSIKQITPIIEEQKKSDHKNILQAPLKILDALRGIQKICVDGWGVDFEPNFNNLTRPLEKLVRLMDEEDVVSITPGEEGSGGTPLASGFLKNIQSRQDAVRHLEQVCKYLEDYEPTSPAPLLIKRAIKVMDMNFIDIVKNMAPDGLNQAIFILGEDA